MAQGHDHPALNAATHYVAGTGDGTDRDSVASVIVMASQWMHGWGPVMGVCARVVAAIGVVLTLLGVGPAQGVTPPVGGLHPGRSSFLAPAPVMGVDPGGPSTASRPDCKLNQIESVAFTESSPDGVLGVVELKGTKVFHKKRWRHLRCALPFSKGPRGFLAADGDPLDVPRGQADKTNPPQNPYSWIDLEDGRAAWGFGWFGSYCGDAPRYVVMKLERHRGMLWVPFDGPTPPCPTDSSDPISSTLTDGPAGSSNSAVQPAPPSFLALTTSARFVGKTTSKKPAPVEVTITDTSDRPVALDPCPMYEVRTEDRVGKHERFASRSFGSKTPGCKTKALIVTPSQPVSFRVGRGQLNLGWSVGVRRGSTFRVHIDLAGIPTAHASTTVR